MVVANSSATDAESWMISEFRSDNAWSSCAPDQSSVFERKPFSEASSSAWERIVWRASEYVARRDV